MVYEKEEGRKKKHCLYEIDRRKRTTLRVIRSGSATKVWVVVFRSQLSQGSAADKVGE